jgi:hypothetical protein
VSNPLQNRGEKLPTEEKITAILDLLGIIARALLAIFGKRRTDQ